MTPNMIKCPNCAAEAEISGYCKFVVCPYCGQKIPCPEFEYRAIDWKSSMYSSVRMWMDCPSCRSRNMYLGAQKRAWKCPDCGYGISDKDRKKSVFWFCDECEAYLNVQPGFSTKSGAWKCRNCGYVNDVTRSNII